MGQVMEQIEIEISCSGALELFVENPLDVLFSAQVPARKLRRDIKAFARMTLYEAFLNRALGIAARINVGGIKITVAGFEETVDERIGCFEIDFSVFKGRQTHQAEAQFRNLQDFFSCHDE